MKEHWKFNKMLWNDIKLDRHWKGEKMKLQMEAQTGALARENSIVRIVKRSSNIVVKDFRRNWLLYVMILPVLAYYVIFCYKPIYGLLIAFLDYVPGKPFSECTWVGMKHFIDFFNQPYFMRTLRNTLAIGLGTLVVCFPAPIILALLFNELRSEKYKKVCQTLTYLPHFISLLVVAGLIKDFTASDGLITGFLSMFGMDKVSMLTRKELFLPVYVISDLWQSVGWGSIIYLAALSGINTELYEAARIDGAGRWRQTISITLPSLLPTILVLLILRIGSLLSVGFEKIILLYNPATYETSDVISSYVYRMGLEQRDWSFSTAVGLFNSVLNFILLVSANFFSGKFMEASLW